MTVNIDNSGKAAVDRDYFWRPIRECPGGVKVQLLGQGGVATYGIWSGRDEFFTHWAPLPVKPRAETNEPT